jgi:hypothetical protein
MVYGQFFRITGAFIIGVVSLVAAIILFGLFLPLVLALFAALFPFITGAMLILVAVVVLWLIVYFFMMLGAGIYYAIRKPMEVNVEEEASYGLEGVTEAGLREKGETAVPRAPRARKQKKARKRSSRKPAKARKPARVRKRAARKQKKKR